MLIHSPVSFDFQKQKICYTRDGKQVELHGMRKDSPPLSGQKPSKLCKNAEEVFIFQMSAISAGPTLPLVEQKVLTQRQQMRRMKTQIAFLMRLMGVDPASTCQAEAGSDQPRFPPRPNDDSFPLKQRHPSLANH